MSEAEPRQSGERPQGKRRAPKEDPRPSLTKEQLLALEDELIIEYQKEDFQTRLHELSGAAGDDELARLRARQEACLPIQLPIIERYGFERTQKGVARSVYAFEAYDTLDPEHYEFAERADILTWLVNPTEQWRRPKPYVPVPLWSAMPSARGLEDQEDQQERLPFSVVVRHLSGDAVAEVTVAQSDRVVMIREAVERLSAGGHLSRPFKLVFGGAVLGDAQTVEAAGLHEGAEVSKVNMPPFQVLTASGDRTARLHDAASGEVLQTFSDHGASVRSAAFSPDCFRVLTASRDRTAKIWSATTGECELTLTGHSNAVNAAVFSPDGARVATASDDVMVKIWDAATGNCEKSIYAGGECVNGVVFSPDGRYLLLACGDNTAKMLDSFTGDQVWVIEGHTSFVTSATFSPDGLKVVTTSDDRRAALWDTTNGACIHIFTGHRRAVNSAAFSADGQQLLTASDDCSVLLFDTALAACRQKILHERSANSAEFSPDGRQVLTACDDRKARLFHAASGELVLELPGHQGAVYSAVFGVM